jgi:hypothetical protein
MKNTPLNRNDLAMPQVGTIHPDFSMVERPTGVAWLHIGQGIDL